MPESRLQRTREAYRELNQPKPKMAIRFVRSYDIAADPQPRRYDYYDTTTNQPPQETPWAV